MVEQEFALEDFSCEHLKTGSILALTRVLDECQEEDVDLEVLKGL